MATLATPGGSREAGTLTVTGTAPGVENGTALVTLEVERDVILEALAPVDPEHPDTATVQANWRQAVNKVVAQVTVPVVRGAFSANLSWSRAPTGILYVKVYAQDTRTDSFGFGVLR